jgi:hypothetical protein
MPRVAMYNVDKCTNNQSQLEFQAVNTHALTFLLVGSKKKNGSWRQALAFCE